MAKFLKNLFILIIVLIVAGYFASAYILNATAHRLAPVIIERLADNGIIVESWDFENIRFTSLRTITSRNLWAQIKLSHESMGEYNAVVHVDRLNAHIAGLRNPAVTTSADGFQFRVERIKEIPGTSFARFDHGYVAIHEPIYLSDPRVGLLKIMKDITGLFRQEETLPRADFRALVTFHVRGKEADAFLYTVTENGKPRLRFEEKDIAKMATRFDLELSDDEIHIIASYPLRAPAIMRITAEAKETSRNAHHENPNVPEDAYRHVLWSYLLTKEFGADFAEQVTDAHEVLPTNTAKERQMDFHNNRIGRLYAMRGERKSRLLWLVQHDKAVIKNPGEVQL